MKFASVFAIGMVVALVVMGSAAEAQQAKNSMPKTIDFIPIPQGRIITYLNDGYEFKSGGISNGRIVTWLVKGRKLVLCADKAGNVQGMGVFVPDGCFEMVEK
ncbi:MAG: hypothetical protein M0006_15395 [Magnetospirillum sp.]|nr:hypothetical protein [Magnetospirillum sp.]